MTRALVAADLALQEALGRCLVSGVVSGRELAIPPPEAVEAVLDRAAYLLPKGDVRLPRSRTVRLGASIHSNGVALVWNFEFHVEYQAGDVCVDVTGEGPTVSRSVHDFVDKLRAEALRRRAAKVDQARRLEAEAEDL